MTEAVATVILRYDEGVYGDDETMSIHGVYLNPLEAANVLKDLKTEAANRPRFPAGYSRYVGMPGKIIE